MARRDPLSPHERSERMALVKSSNTGAERLMSKLLRKHGVQYSRNDNRLPGTPDFSITRAKLAIFVDGCFWHGCPKCYSAPQANKSYWQTKLQRNRQRDKRVTRALKALG